jgi:uncharacterized radical SAM superfamily Fe-S cluster-containing enzyme
MNYRSKSLICEHLPEIVFVEITNLCNLRCVMCPVKDMKRETGMMSFGQFKDIADQIKEFGTEKTRLNLYLFGETFFNNSSIGMIAYAKNIGLRLEISTNILPLNEEKICNLISILDRDDCLVLSVDGYNEETYEQIRAGGNFEEMFQRFHWIMREHHRSKKKPCIIVQTICNWGKCSGKLGILNQEDNFVNEFIKCFLSKIWTDIGKDFINNDIEDFICEFKTEYEILEKDGV